jgi:hypothetical protein
MESDRQFSLYPVPADNTISLKITLEDETIVTAYVMDVSGRVISNWMEEKLLAKGITLEEYSLKEMSPGVYLCVVRMNGKTHPQKFIVQH